MNMNSATWMQLIPPSTSNVLSSTTSSTAAATISSRVIDTAGFTYLEVCASVGAASGFVAATSTGQSPLCLWESDVASSATLLSSALQVPGAAYGISVAPSVPTTLYPEQETFATATAPSSTSINSLFTFNVDLKGRKRYLQLQTTWGSTVGTICQNTPKRSLSQPHRSACPPSAHNASHSRSTSAWSAQSILNETAWVYSNRMPPFSAMKRWPASVNSTTSTEPAFPAGLSMVFFCTCSIRESGSSET